MSLEAAPRGARAPFATRLIQGGTIVGSSRFLNVRQSIAWSRSAALAALPAQFEGILRNHMIVPNVGLRDSAYFSVIDSEWPEVKSNLERRLERSA
ncbi:MAG TPA: hypothetical protein VN752_02560 [Solirubrobacterales bacterium]|nr:hypothetical protein [Solirubrobacterales bacterium]